MADRFRPGDCYQWLRGDEPVGDQLPFPVSSRPWDELTDHERGFFCGDDSRPLRPDHAAQILLLDREDAVRFAGWAWSILPGGWPDRSDPAGQRFRYEERLPVHDSWNDEAGRAAVRRWLFDRGLPFRRTVYLMYDRDRVVETTWGMVIRYWDAFAWSVGYAMVAVDHTLQWAGCFHHEDVFVFGSHVGFRRRRRHG